MRSIGLAKTFSYCGYSAVVWNSSQKSAIDMFDELIPGMFIGNTNSVSDGLTKITKEQDTSVYLFDSEGTNWWDVEKVCGLKKVTILCESYHRLNFWKNLNFNARILLTGANVFEYNNGVVRPEFLCDVAVLGQPNAESLKYVKGICYPDSRIKVKIFGSGWNLPQECGLVDFVYGKDILASAKICPVFHHNRTDDILWQAAYNGSFCISNQTGIFDKDVLPQFYSDEDFYGMVEYFIDNEDKRLGYAEKLQSVVKEKHTYFHRIADLMSFEYGDSSKEEILNSYKKFLLEQR